MKFFVLVFSVVVGELWDPPAITSLLSEVGEQQISQLARKYSLDLSPPSFLQNTWGGTKEKLMDSFQSFFQRLPAINTLQQSFLEMYEEDEPLTFELDADTIAKIFNDSLQAAVQPRKSNHSPISHAVIKYAALSDVDPAPSFAELQHPNSTRLNIALNTLGISIDLKTIYDHKESVLALVDAVDDFFEAQQNPETLSAVYSYLEIQADVLPLFHDALPQIHTLTQRALGALREVQPSRINPVTLIPALLELVTAGVSVQAAGERMLPLASLWFKEAFQAADILTSSRRAPNANSATASAMSVYQALCNTCDAVGDMDPYYKSAMHSARDIVNTVQQLTPDAVALFDAYLSALPTIDELGRVLFDMGEDMTGSLRKAMDSFEREGPILIDFYENAEDFIPLLISHFIRILRQGGIATRTPLIRDALPTLRELLDYTRSVYNTNEKRIDNLLASIVSLAASLPRQAVVTRATSDLLLHAAVAVSQARAVLLPNTVKLVESIGNLLDQLIGSSQSGIPSVLAAVRQSFDAAIATLPGVSASIPLITPIVRSSHELTLSVLPTVKVLRDQSLANATIPIKLRQPTEFLLEIASAIPSVVHGNTSRYTGIYDSLDD